MSKDDRKKFTHNEFVVKHKLKSPVAANYYRAQYDDYVPILHASFSKKWKAWINEKLRTVDHYITWKSTLSYQNIYCIFNENQDNFMFTIFFTAPSINKREVFLRDPKVLLYPHECWQQKALLPNNTTKYNVQKITKNVFFLKFSISELVKNKTREEKVKKWLRRLRTPFLLVTRRNSLLKF